MSAGPMTMPPPIPNRPARTPAASPIAMKRITIRPVENECSRWNSFLHSLQHLVGEDVYLLDGRVNVGGDPDSLEFGMHDRRIHDPVLVEQPRSELHVADPVHLK